jgi:hypothetical protein
VGTAATVLGSDTLGKALASLAVAGLPSGGLGGAVAIAGAAAQAVGAAALKCHHDAAAQIATIEKATAIVQADLAKLKALVRRLDSWRRIAWSAAPGSIACWSGCGVNSLPSCVADTATRSSSPS